MNDNADSIITFCDVALGYDGHIVVQGLNFTVTRGDYLCVVGENGSGKSTALKGILRLVVPLQGNIIFSAEISRNSIGYLSQQTAAKKDFPAGVYEIVLSGHSGNMGLRPFYSRREKQTTEENMEYLGITDLRERCFRELSGGQQRRVLLARALCAGRKLLVLDEPAAGLDPVVTADVYSLLKKIRFPKGIGPLKTAGKVSIIFIFFIIGCGNSGIVAAKRNNAGSQSVILPDSIAGKEPQLSAAVENRDSKDNPAIGIGTDEPKLSLIKPNSDNTIVEIKEKMFIAQTNDIYLNAEDYLGKTIKLEGLFKKEQYDGTDAAYCFVLRYGPGCCGNDGNAGFEVAWDKEISAGNSYPNIDDWVEATGELKYYEEDGYPYLYIALSSLNVLDKRGAEYVTQ
jgi:zinc transport system ATP-binding protein